MRGRPVNICSPSRVLPRYRPSRTSNGIQMRRHPQIPEEADDYLDERYLRTYFVDSRTFQFLPRQAKPFSGPSPGSGIQFLLPNALQYVGTSLFMA